MTRKRPAQELQKDVLVRASDMGQGRSDYEAFHTLSPAIHLREIHTHDFFELYLKRKDLQFRESDHTKTVV